MAITLIEISQDNKYNGSDLLPVHSQLVFLVNATWTTAAPDNLYVGIYDESDTLLDTYKCIPYSDILTNVRQFAFIASESVRSMMESFDDTLQAVDTLVHIPEMTKVLRFRFYDPDTPATYDEDTFTFVHGSSQFGERPNFHTVFNNDNDDYYGQEGHLVYVYFYNSDALNTLYVLGTPVVNIVLELGAWVMNDIYTKSVDFDVPAGYAITDIYVQILEDDILTPFNYLIAGSVVYDTDHFDLEHILGTYFEAGSDRFDDLTQNRGYIFVELTYAGSPVEIASIGGWDMDTDATKVVSYSPPGGYSIASQTVTIFEDDTFTETNLTLGGSSAYDTDHFDLTRTGAGYYDAEEFDDDTPQLLRCFIKVQLQEI